MYDHSTVSESWLKEGQKLVLEPGAPLLPSEIMIRYYVRSSNHSRVEIEQTVDKNITIGQVGFVVPMVTRITHLIPF